MRVLAAPVNGACLAGCLAPFPEYVRDKAIATIDDDGLRATLEAFSDAVGLFSLHLAGVDPNNPDGASVHVPDRLRPRGVNGATLRVHLD